MTGNQRVSKVKAAWRVSVYMRQGEEWLKNLIAGWPYVLLATEQTKLSRQSLRQFRIQRPNIGSAPQMLEEEVIKSYRRVSHPKPPALQYLANRPCSSSKMLSSKAQLGIVRSFMKARIARLRLACVKVDDSMAEATWKYWYDLSARSCLHGPTCFR